VGNTRGGEQSGVVYVVGSRGDVYTGVMGAERRIYKGDKEYTTGETTRSGSCLQPGFIGKKAVAEVAYGGGLFS
jgi:hypothetical protein